MKKFALLAVILMGIVFSLGATQEQSLVMSVLTALKFEFVPPPDGRIGGPMEFKITKKTIKFLDDLRARGKVLVIENDGSLRIK